MKKLVMCSWLSWPLATGREGGLNHVTESHHLCETGKYRVWKARVDIDTDNFLSFIEVVNDV